MAETGAQPGGVRFFPIYVVMFGCMAAMMGFVAQAGAMAKTFELAPWQIGLTVTVSGLAWVLASRGFGRRSDRVGRKPVMLLGGTIFVCFYAVLLISVTLGLSSGATGLIMLLALIVSRAGLGLGFAAVPTAANAFIADNTPPAARAGEMGRLGAAQAMGMIAGPALVALLAWSGLIIPLLVLSALPVIGLILLRQRLIEPPVQAQGQLPPLSMLDKRLWVLCLIGIGTLFCVGTAQIAVGFLVIDRFGMSPEQGAQYAGLALTSVGIALIPAQLSVRWLGWRPRTLMAVGALLGALGFAGAGLAVGVAMLLISYAGAGFGIGWVFAAVSAQAANSVAPDEQGRAAGAISASQGLGVMLGPLLGALIYALNPAAPYLLCSAILVAVSVLAATGLSKPQSMG